MRNLWLWLTEPKPELHYGSKFNLERMPCKLNEGVSFLLLCGDVVQGLQKERPQEKEKAMLDPWVKIYKTRKWKTYEIMRSSRKEPPLEKETTLDICCSASEWAKAVKERPNRFYWDEELAAADLDPLCGGSLHRLARAWNKHPAGKLVMRVFTGIGPMIFTYAVEVD